MRQSWIYGYIKKTAGTLTLKRTHKNQSYCAFMGTSRFGLLPAFGNVPINFQIIDFLWVIPAYSGKKRHANQEIQSVVFPQPPAPCFFMHSVQFPLQQGLVFRRLTARTTAATSTAAITAIRMISTGLISAPPYMPELWSWTGSLRPTQGRTARRPVRRTTSSRAHAWRMRSLQRMECKEGWI